MGFFERFKNRSIAHVELVTERGNGFYAWNGKIYQSDIVRACMRPKVKAIGKLVAKHIRETVSKDGTRSLVVNPDAYIRFLLEEPNPHMTGQKMLEKAAAQLALNNNAFILIARDENGYPVNLFPIMAIGAEAIYSAQGYLFLKFTMQNGKNFTFPYTDILHLRQDYGENDIFGDPIAPALEPLMEIVSTTDQGIVKAIRNSSVIRWLLKFQTGARDEDIKASADRFAASFLDISNGSGVAAVNSNAEATQIQPNDYVPNAAQTDRTKARIYSLFNTNPEIVDSSRTEDEWNSYFDAEVEPVLVDMQGEFTRKLFSRKERGFGNKIVFEASAWDSASIATKLNLLQMVDRGALTPNEWRLTFNLAPVPGGDKPIRRLDTRPTEEEGDGK